MSWLAAAIIASISGTFLLSLIYWYLYAQEKKDYLKIWAIGWEIAIIHYIAELLFTLYGPSQPLLTLSQLATGCSAAFIFWGTTRFLDRRVKPILYLLVGSLIIWLLAAAVYDYSFFLTTLPTSLFLGAAFMWTGITFWRTQRSLGIFYRLIAVSFIIWSWQKFLYPLVRPTTAFAAWGYLLTTLLGLFIALCILLHYIHQTRSILSDSDQRFRLLAENSQDMIYFIQTEPEFKCTYLNPAFSRICGFPAEDFYQDSQLFFQLIHPDDRKMMQQLIRQPIAGQSTSIRWQDPQGRLIWTKQQIIPVQDDQGRVIFLQGIGQDVTTQKRDIEIIWQQANHDDLTDMPNRTYLQNQLDNELAKARKESGSLAVLFLSLDKYKQVNDLLGHGTGDLFIAACAAKIKKTIQKDCQLIAHWGGNEFVILWPNTSSLMDVENLAESILKELEHPAKLDIYEFPVAASIGIALYPIHGKQSETLLKSAGLAMYLAKKNSLRRFSVYSPEMSRVLEEKVTLEESLRKALLNNDFILDYQAQFSLASGHKLVGMEALIRWQHPRQGMILPGAFLELTEETGLINHLGAWVLETACAQNLKWQSSSGKNLPVSVNISSVQFRQRDFIDLVKNVLQRTGLDPALLILEITEETAMENMTLTQDKLRKLRVIGVKTALDNFGIGSSAIAHLKDLPVSRLKIDRSFLKEIFSTPHMTEILKIIIALGQELNLDTLVEGVENQRQLDLLSKMGCRAAQGNFLAPPMTARDFEIRFLTRGKAI